MGEFEVTIRVYRELRGPLPSWRADHVELRRVGGQPGGQQALCEAAANGVATDSCAWPSAGEDYRPE